MGLFTRKGAEARSATFTQSMRQSFLEIVGISGTGSVSLEEALGVPAVWAAVNFIAGTVAGLPLHVYDKTTNGKKRVKATARNPSVVMLHDAVSDDMSSFDWRFNMMVGALTEGRFVTYIHRNAAGQPTDLYPMPNATASILPNGRKQYKTTGNGESKTYDQSDVLDVTFMLKGDMVSHRSPLRQCAIAIGKAHNANKYGSKLFENGGLPAFTLQGPFSSGTSAQRASNDIAEATKRAAKNGGTVLAIPEGHKLEPLSSSPDKMQLVETQRFAVEEIARIYSLPPTFLQDLTHGTFNNTEQQDLHFVKHTMKRWLEQLEAEMNLKLFGRGSNRIVEFNLDGLLRGDYKTRMEGNAQAINTGQLTPDEARAQENREPLPGGDRLYIQGATVPLEKQNGVTQDEP